MDKKIKVLTLGDHPLSPSGVGSQTKYVIEALPDTYRAVRGKKIIDAENEEFFKRINMLPLRGEVGASYNVFRNETARNDMDSLLDRLSIQNKVNYHRNPERAFANHVLPHAQKLLYEIYSLTKAGEIVGITQPAVSSALSKLREYFDDQLFIRVGQGVKPTAKTENIIIHVRDALSILQKSIEVPESFDPAVSSRTFRLSLNDVSEGRVLPILMTKIRRVAPNVKVSSYYTMRELSLIHISEPTRPY